MNSHGAKTLALALSLCVLVTGFAACGSKEGNSAAAPGTAKASRSTQTGQSNTTAADATGQKLSAQAESELSAIEEAANLADLKWPNFSDYSTHVKNFYNAGGNALAWIRSGKPTPQALAIIGVMQQADLKGLSAADYDGPAWAGRIDHLDHSPNDSDFVHFDVALTVCVMRYISDLHIGKVNPKYFHFGLDVESHKYSLPDFLRDHLVNSNDVKPVLESVEPPFPGYRRTEATLQQYLQLAKQDSGETLPVPAKPVAPGQPFAGVARLTKLLRLLGDLPADAIVPDSQTTYDGALVPAVKHFQKRHGIDPLGRLDAETVNALNTPLTQRVRQLQLAMERWRWAPHEFTEAPIVVNIPEFRLRAYKLDGNVDMYMDVVVGKSYGHQTPIFSDEIRYVVIRPYWNVPPSIQEAEIVPHLRKDRSYLDKHNFEIITRTGEIVASSPVSDEVLEKLRKNQLEVREKPGPKNSLGLVKIIFPNSNNVYMHGTSAEELFSRYRRDFSHGCVRLEDPAVVAAWVLRNNPGWDLERMREAMKDGPDNVQVNLVRPIPILIVYASAIVTEEGEPRFYEDIYGLDAELEKVLAKGYPYPG